MKLHEKIKEVLELKSRVLSSSTRTRITYAPQVAISFYEGKQRASVNDFVGRSLFRSTPATISSVAALVIGVSAGVSGVTTSGGEGIGHDGGARVRFSAIARASL